MGGGGGEEGASGRLTGGGGGGGGVGEVAPWGSLCTLGLTPWPADFGHAAAPVDPARGAGGTRAHVATCFPRVEHRAEAHTPLLHREGVLLPHRLAAAARLLAAAARLLGVGARRRHGGPRRVLATGRLRRSGRALRLLRCGGFLGRGGRLTRPARPLPSQKRRHRPGPSTVWPHAVAWPGANRPRPGGRCTARRWRHRRRASTKGRRGAQQVGQRRPPRCGLTSSFHGAARGPRSGGQKCVRRPRR